MPTVGAIHGKDVVIAILNGSVYNQLGCAKEVSIEFSRELFEAACKDSDWSVSVPGMKSATLSASGFHIGGNPVTPDVLFGHFDDGTELTFTFGLKEGVILTGDKYYTGKMLISQLGITAGMQTEDYSVSFKVTGEVTQETAL
jgi:predicted secreted protein